MNIILILVYIAVLLFAADIAYRGGYESGFRDGLTAAKRTFHEIIDRRQKNG